jgi:type 2 lantibiotic biosynthesis protein LanM
VKAPWVKAFGLAERARGAGERGVDNALGARRLERWQAQAPFGDAAIFAQRLQVSDLSEEAFFATLAEPTASLSTRTDDSAAWLEELLAAFDHTHAVPDELQGELAILIVAEPLVERARARVLDAARRLAASGAPFEPEALVAQLDDVLPARLFPMLARTVSHELQTASREGLLPGETPGERFAAFVEYLAEGGALDLFGAYPVLGRAVTTTVMQWADASIEFMQRLAQDFDGLREIGPVGHVVSVTGGVSDPHRGNREVLLVGFDSGLRVVYKPKPLAVDSHFQALLRWLNARGQRPVLRQLTVIDRGDYGWVEYAEAGPCASVAEVERFYRRQGSLLALLHVLAATDLHFENLIAAGEDPVIVDLEALFHPSMRTSQPESAFERVLAKMETSVLSVGMLPQPMRLSAGAETVDVSAMGAADGQLSPRGVPRWVGGTTDEAHIEYARVEVASGSGTHRPTLDGRPIGVLAHVDAFIDGFRQTYGLLLAHREELLHADGPLAIFRDDPVRLLLRPTVVYARLLGESFHPDLLRDGLERDRFFDRLWVAVPNQPRLVPAIAAEQTDLRAGDIPAFATTPGSDVVFSSSGDVLSNVIVASGAAVVRERLEALGPDDLARQEWCIRAALGSLPDAPEPSGAPVARRSAPATSVALRLAARRIGTRLGELAIRGTDDVTWLGFSDGVVSALGSDLYDGLPGVILFLATLGDADSVELARAALRRLRRQLADGVAPLRTIGALSGWGGLVYTYTHLADLLQEPELREAAFAIVGETLPPLIAGDTAFDVAHGAAGCVGAALGLHGVEPRYETLAAARLCGERLLGHTPTLTGFAHGAAGHAWALERLWRVTGDSRYAAAAHEARHWENTQFSAEVGNWPDLRYPREEGRFMVAWCHGAAGIGLSRNEPRAVQAVRCGARRPNHALCHGELGNLEVLPIGEARERAAALVAAVEASEWVCATPFGVEAPGLMTGLAGIGYGLLRLAEPERIPSVLRFEGPIK